MLETLHTLEDETIQFDGTEHYHILEEKRISILIQNQDYEIEEQTGSPQSNSPINIIDGLNEVQI